MFQNVSELFTSEPVYRLGYRLDDRSSIPGEASDGIFSLRLHVQTGSGDHPATSPVGTGGGVKLNTHLSLVPRLRMRGVILPLFSTSSRPGV